MLPIDELSALSKSIAKAIIDENDGLAEELLLAGLAEHGYTKKSPMSIETWFKREHTTVQLVVACSDKSISFGVERVGRCHEIPVIRDEEGTLTRLGASLLMDATMALLSCVRLASTKRYFPNRNEANSRKTDDALFMILSRVA